MLALNRAGSKHPGGTEQCTALSAPGTTITAFLGESGGKACTLPPAPRAPTVCYSLQLERHLQAQRVSGGVSEMTVCWGAFSRAVPSPALPQSNCLNSKEQESRQEAAQLTWDSAA